MSGLMSGRFTHLGACGHQKPSIQSYDSGEVHPSFFTSFLTTGQVPFPHSVVAIPEFAFALKPRAADSALLDASVRGLRDLKFAKSCHTRDQRPENVQVSQRR